MQTPIRTYDLYCQIWWVKWRDMKEQRIMFQHTVSPAAISWQYQVIFGPGSCLQLCFQTSTSEWYLFSTVNITATVYMPSLMLHVFRGMLLCLWLTSPRDVHHTSSEPTHPTQFFFSRFFPVAVVAFAAMVGVVLVLVVAAAGIIVTFQLVIRCRYYPLLFSKAAGLPPSESKLREQIESFQGQLPRISCWICKPTTVSIRFIPQDVFTFIPSLHYSWNPARSFPIFKTGETRQVLIKLYSAWFCFLCFLLPDSGSPDS